MSYDIAFKAKIEGTYSYVPVGNCEANTTWNVRKMICEATGLEWKNEQNNGLCKDVIPKIEYGCQELEMHPEKYKKYEPANGWGSVRTTLFFFQNILCAWVNLKEEYPEVADVATFWIE